ncbi:hypothetical protein BCR44DRAFT_34144 [Catenaria anguillulae PL171]|uniref:Uncharacterized protein n=1 Tax=Catenaria anguillulae PL171 TaxID=765915 RepID=A0A1Y2HUS0_9FUNG|nr:hypothetical protein BCR44DRAFT_34144 [Catenaria anguillulae PL171]
MDNLMPAPSLPLQLIEHLLAVAVRASTYQPGRAIIPPTLLALINVLGPRSEFPGISKAAIMCCWWVDLDLASRMGNLDLICFLDHMSKAYPHRPLQWTNKAMDCASGNGFIHVLGWWWRRFGHVCWYTKDAVTGAAESGHLEVVQWWTRMVERKLVTAFKISELESWILSAATKSGHLAVCEWWLKHRPEAVKQHQLPPDLFSVAIVHALRVNDPKFTLFHWWLSHIPPSGHDSALNNIAASNKFKLMNAVKQHSCLNHAAALELPLLLHRFNLLRRLASLCIMCACVADDSTRIVEWLARLGGSSASSGQVGNKNNRRAFLNGYTIASEAGSVRVLDWLRARYPLNRLSASHERLVDQALLSAAENGHQHVLQWWISASGFLLKPQRREFVLAASAHAHMLPWLWDSKLVAEWPRDLLEHAARNNRTFVFDWWAKVYSPGKTSWANTQINRMTRESVTEWAFSCGSIEILEWWTSSPWFDSEMVDGKTLIAGTRAWPTKPAAYAWWMQSDLFGTIPNEVFASFFCTSYTILLDRYIRAVQVIPAEKDEEWCRFVNERVTEAARRGSICMLDWWWMQRRTQQKPDWDIFKSNNPFPQHVQAWIKLHQL